MNSSCENVNICSMLTENQQRQLFNMGYGCILLEQVPLEDFKKITKNKTIIDRFMRYKFSFKLRLVA